jgi:hypothetical protein
LKPLLALLQVLAGLSLIPWPLVLLMTVFLFDAPGSDSSPLTVALALAILVYPAPILAGAWGFWKNRGTATNAVLARFTLLSLSSPALLVILIGALEFFCDGQFACPAER